MPRTHPLSPISLISIQHSGKNEPSKRVVPRPLELAATSPILWEILDPPLLILCNSVRVCFSEPVCFEEFTSSSGNFTTPNYPVKYFTDHQCTWIFHVLPGKSHRQNSASLADPKGKGVLGMRAPRFSLFDVMQFSGKNGQNNALSQPLRVGTHFWEILDLRHCHMPEYQHHLCADKKSKDSVKLVDPKNLGCPA